VTARREEDLVSTTATLPVVSGPILEMRSITKEFPGVKALSDVSITVRAGEILRGR